MTNAPWQIASYPLEHRFHEAAESMGVMTLDESWTLSDRCMEAIKAPPVPVVMRDRLEALARSWSLQTSPNPIIAQTYKLAAEELREVLDA